MTSDALNEFERRLAHDLAAYADAAGVSAPPAQVVADVTSRGRPRRAWLVPAGLAAAVLVAIASLAGIQALNSMASRPGPALRPSTATVNGLVYDISVGRSVYGLSLEVGPEDLFVYGTISAGGDPILDSTTVYAIHGVDPETLLLVRAADDWCDRRGAAGEYAWLVRGPILDEVRSYLGPPAATPQPCSGG